MIDKQTQWQLESVLTFMQRNDPQGDYMSYLDDIQCGKMTFQEVVLILMAIIKRWKKDLNNPHDPRHKDFGKQHFILAGMI